MAKKGVLLLLFGFFSFSSLQAQVGIGTTTPMSTLDVEGGVAIGASYSGSTAAPTNGLAVQGFSALGTTNPTTQLTVVGKVDVFPTLGGTPTAITDRSGASADGGRIWFDYINSGPAIIMSDFDEGPRLYFRQAGTGSESTPQYESYFSMVDNSNNISLLGGNLGIGASAPSELLTVEGGNILMDNASHIYMEDAGGTANSILNYNDATLNEEVVIGSGSSVDHVSLFTSGSRRVTVNASGFMGINTTTPDTWLHIRNTSTNSVYGLVENTSANGFTSFVVKSDQGSINVQSIGSTDATIAAKYRGWGRLTVDAALDGLTILTVDNDPLTFETDLMERMRISGTTGYIGIGTASPLTTLHVEDAISEVGDEGIRISDNTAAGSFLKLKDGSNVASHFIPMIYGKGIGTATPERNGLMIYGEVGEDGGDDIGIILDGRNASSALTTANILEVRNYGSAHVAVDPTGNVGVGTVNPSAKLDLVGTMKQNVVTLAADLTAPDVSGGNIFITSANTGATAINDLVNPVAGQIVRIICGSSTNASTITDGGNFNIAGNWTPQVDDVIILFVRADNDYIELGRVNN